MRQWNLSVPLDPQREQPLFLQLASAVAADIRGGRLKAGEPLPGTRELAALLGVNRNTVVASYGELAAEGLVHTRVGGGTFVAAPAPHERCRPMAVAAADEPTYALRAPPALPPQPPAPAAGILSLALGTPDARLFPARAFARAFRRAIGPQSKHRLGGTDCRGHARLRGELAALLTRSRGLSCSAENVMVTRSIEQAIDLVARALLAPGDVVVVEAFGYPPAWNVLRLAGARLVGIPLDDDGLDVDALETLLRAQPVRAVFLTPHHQFPTAAVMAPRRRARLAQLARRHRFAIIEDDYDHEFHYAGKPVLPIAAGADGANAIYVGSLANLLAPGVSTGFVVAPPSVFRALRTLRAASDARNDAAMECAIAELFEDGELLRHVRRLRRVNAARRDALAEALRRHLGDALAFRVPDGGTAIWAAIDPDVDVDAWARAGEREGVAFHGAQRYAFDGQPQPFARLNFAAHNESELAEAARRMARALTRERTNRLPAGPRATLGATARLQDSAAA